MLAEAAGAGQFAEEGFAPVPRVQIVTIEGATAPCTCRPDDAFKRAAREEAPDRPGQARTLSGSRS